MTAVRVEVGENAINHPLAFSRQRRGDEEKREEVVVRFACLKPIRKLEETRRLCSSAILWLLCTMFFLCYWYQLQQMSLFVVYFSLPDDGDARRDPIPSRVLISRQIFRESSSSSSSSSSNNVNYLNDGLVSGSYYRLAFDMLRFKFLFLIFATNKILNQKIVI